MLTNQAAFNPANEGECDDDGQWLLDGEFTVFTVEEELIRVCGWGCHVEVQ